MSLRRIRRFLSELFNVLPIFRALSMPIMGIMLAAVVMMLAIPFPAPWSWFFEGIPLVFVRVGLMTFWGLLTVGSCVALVFPGRWHHQATGGSSFAPLATLLALVLILGMTIFFIAEWSVDWSFALVVVWVAVLGFIVFRYVTPGVVLYSEIWRLLFNARIVNRVTADIEAGTFKTPAQTEWGSPHCLAILRYFYADKKYNLIKKYIDNDRTPADTELELYRRGAVYLTDYLLVPRWNDQAEPLSRRLPETIDIQREGMTLYAHFNKPFPADISRNSFHSRHPVTDLPDEYLLLLDAIFQLRYQPNNQPKLAALVSHYESLKRKPHLQRIVADTWLVVAHHTTGYQFAFDVWMRMQQHKPDSITAEFAPQMSGDVADICARKIFATYYKQWLKTGSEDWDSELNLQTKKAVEEGGIRANIPKPIEMSFEVSSWGYPYIWQPIPVKLFQRGLVIVFMAVVMGAFWLLNPGWIPVSPPTGWNTIDHVTDRRWGHDYTESTATALAGCGSQLGIGTEDGLTVIDTGTRIPWEREVAVPVVDVRCSPDGFLVLGRDQSIHRFQLAAQPERQVAWLPAPVQPTLPLHRLAPESIVAGLLDEHGWLLAIEGLGLAQYRFSQTENGQIYRTREWNTMALGSSVKDIIFTSVGIWMTTPGGQIQYISRDTLEPVDENALTVPNLVRFDADYDGSMAYALDRSGQLWLFRDRWQGPFLGADIAGCAGLQTVKDITTVRYQAPYIWLGTHSGLYAYHTTARNMRCVVQDFDVAQMELLVTAEQALLIVAGGSGLRIVDTATTPVPQVAYTGTQSVLTMNLSADGSQLTYLTSDHAVLTVSLSTDGFTSQTIIPAAGWKPSSQPQVIAVEPLDSGQRVFATDEKGAFLYQPSTREYLDFSSVEGQTSKAEAFTMLGRAANYLLAVADHTPLIYPMAASDSGVASQWHRLDPSGDTEPIALAYAGDAIFGLSEIGVLYQYAYPDTPRIQSYLTGRASSLENVDNVTYSATGDLTVTDESEWRTAFIHQGYLITYNSSDGNLEQSQLPESLREEDRIAQVRLVGGQPLYRLAGGEIVNESGTVVFGAGGLPFTPENTTFAVQRSSADAVLVAGATGEILEYNSAAGSWEKLAAIPLDGKDTIVRMQDTFQGLLAQLTSGQVLRLTDDEWSVDRSIRQWAVDRSGEMVWFLTSDGLEQYRAGVTEPVRYSQVSAMRPFVEAAVYAWQMDENRVIFFSHDAHAGVYDKSTGFWHTVEVPSLSRPAQFLSYQGDLLVLDSGDILRLSVSFSAIDSGDSTPIFEAERQLALPKDFVAPSMALSENTLMITAVSRGMPIVLRCSRMENVACTEFRRGEIRMPQQFNPEQVIYAEAQANRVLLLEKSGAIAEYDAGRGTWKSVRPSTSGEQVFGWFNPQDSTDQFILVRTASDETKVIRLNDGKLQFEFSEAPEALFAIGQEILEVSQQSLADFGITVNQPSLVRRIETQGLPVEEVSLPEDGVLASTDTIHIERQNGATAYHFNLGQGFQPWLLTSSGFVQDTADDIALSGSGNVWAIQSGQLIRLLPLESGILALQPVEVDAFSGVQSLTPLLSGDFRVTGAENTTLWLRDSGSQLEVIPPEQAQTTLATLAFADHSLTWYQTDAAGISAAWDLPSIPVWEEDTLAVQTIDDVALAADGALLVMTRAGLLTHDGATYALRAFDPNVVNRQFLSFVQTGRVFLLNEGQISAEWRSQRFEPVAPDETQADEFSSGGWIWRIQQTGNSTRTISIQYPEDGHERRWTETAPYQFQDDRVIRIVSPSSGASAQLLTGDGLWAFTPGRGRGARVAAVDAFADVLDDSAETRSVALPVLRVNYERGVITLAATDESGKPLFQDGRFFFDTATRITQHDGAVFLFIPGRGILVRDPAQPPHILNYLPFPEDIPTIAYPRLQSTEEGLRIELNMPDRRVTWQLVRQENTYQFQPTQENIPVYDSFGLFRWQTSAENPAQLVPVLVTPDGDVQSLPTWWHNDRFAWDWIDSVGALSGDRLILAANAGVLAMDGGAETPFAATNLWLIPGINHIETARHEAEPAGLLLGEAGAPPAYLLQLGATDMPRLIDSDELPLQYEAVLQAGFAGEGESRHLTFTPSWLPADETAGSPVLESLIPSLPTARLIQSGRFTFDNAFAAGIQADGVTWVVASDCAGDVCPVTQNSLTSDETPLFILQGVWTAPAQLEALRPAATDGIYGLASRKNNDEVWRIYQHNFADAPAVAWTVVEPPTTGDAFRTGDFVHLDVSSLEWTAEPRYQWSVARAAFTQSPPDYPLFASQDNQRVALAFDVITALEVDSAGQQILLGTKGGIITLPYSGDGRTLFTVQNSPASLLYQIPNQVIPLTGIIRIRQDSAVRYWIQLEGQEKAVALTFDIGADVPANVILTDEAWNTQVGVYDRFVIHLNGTGFDTPNGQYRQSNDAFGIGTAPLSGMVDFYAEPSGAVIWLLSRDEGLFKVLVHDVP